MTSIIYNPHSLHDFRDYGISIPLLNERVQHAVEKISKTYSFKETQITPFTLEDLLVAYSKEFIATVKNNPSDIVLKTYELLNDDGTYNRYNPQLAKKPLTDFITKALLHVSGTYHSSKLAIKEGFSYHFGGGMHHAMSNSPAGFCMFNDIIITAKTLQKNRLIKNVIVIDLDCHKGDGTAQMSQFDESIRTYSIHMKDGWPLDNKDKSSPSFIPSTLDVPIDPNDNYIEKLQSTLPHFLNTDDAFAIVVHGVDVYKGDNLESSSGINLSSEEVLNRDKFVYNQLKERGIKQSWVLGGGYGKVSHLYVQFLQYVINQQQI